MTEYWKDVTTPQFDGETFKDVPGYEGLYQCSSLGRVKSLERKIILYNGSLHPYRERFLKQGKKKDGYLIVVLYKDGITKCFPVHHLVMLTFVSPRPEGMDIDHKNTIRVDNRLSNLHYCTRKENMNNCITKQKISEMMRRIRKRNARKIKQFNLDGTLVKCWDSPIEIERELKISRSNILICCKGLKGYRTAGGFKWSYA